MQELAKRERDANHQVFMRHFNYQTSVISSDLLDNSLYVKREHDVLKGIRIDKKNCVYKRPLYEHGEWENQFGTSPFMNNLKFDIQTKKR